MKVRFEVELEVSPLEGELTPKQQQMVAGMMQRLLLGRVRALNGSKHGGEKAPTGWEVLCTNVDVNLMSRQK